MLSFGDHFYLAMGYIQTVFKAVILSLLHFPTLSTPHIANPLLLILTNILFLTLIHPHSNLSPYLLPLPPFLSPLNPTPLRPKLPFHLLYHLNLLQPLQNPQHRSFMYNPL
jgi:hypothetical protein